MPYLANITFTSPAMLTGMALAGLPVLAHLLTRRTRKKIVFPTVRLLRESVASQSRLYRLRKWLLLILRCLAIALIAWAFARPVWMERNLQAPTGDKGVALVLVLDVSASSSQQAEGVSLITAMRAVAGRTLDALAEGADLANIVYASAHPHAAFPQFSNNLPAVRQELQQLAPTSERANLPEAFALAGRILKEHAGQKRLVVISDMQRTNWSEITLKDSGAELLPVGTRLTVVPVQASEVENVGLSNPRASPVQPIANRPFQLMAHAANYAPRDRVVQVEATVDGRSVGAQSVSLKAWEGRDVSFEATLDKPGMHNVVFSVPPDDLAVDNQAYLVVKAVSRVPVAVVGDDNPNQQGSAAYFLTRALAPRGTMGDDLEVRPLAGADLTYGRISDAEAVLVGYVGTLGKEALEALYMYAVQGGGVVIFCGEGPVAENMLAFGALAKQGDLLPWMPTMQRDLPKEGGLLRLGEGAWRSDLLADFDEQSQLAIKQIRFTRVWSTSPLKANAVALMTFTDSTPALTLQYVGAGKVVLANFSPALSCSDLGKYGSFVALTHSLVNYLRLRQDWRTGALAGDPFRITLTAQKEAQGAKFAVTGPDERPCEVQLAVEPTEVQVSIPRPTMPGFYRIVKGEQTVSQAAVNVDPRESDLRRIEEEVVRDHLRNDKLALEIHGPQTEGPVLRVRGQPLWQWFMFAAMAAIAVELILLGIWKK